MAASDDADFARCFAVIGDCPCRGATDFPVIKPDVMHLACGGKLGDEGKDMHAFAGDFLDRMGDLRMHRRGDGDGMTFICQGAGGIGGGLR